MLFRSAKVQRSTERATKDVATDLAGEVLFADVIPEEKTDRQGNTTRIAQRGGLLWVLSGDVYNLLPGAEPVVSNGDRLQIGDVLATTQLISANGGTVRWQSGSREIEIVTADLLLDWAEVAIENTGGREILTLTTEETGQRFLLRTTPGQKVHQQAIVAELVDERYRTTTGGILRYAGVEIAKGNRKHGYEVIQSGSLLWIPEESHEVNKDISLLLVEDGQYVEAGTEVVKDIYCHCSGIIETHQKNDILREIIIKPGELLWELEPEQLPLEDGQILTDGTQIGEIVTSGLRQVEWVENSEGTGLLLRPVEEFVVETAPAATPSQERDQQQSGRHIELRSVQRLSHKDGERVKSVEGVQLLSTQLVLEISGAEALENLAADIELLTDEKGIQRLQLVILETLSLRRDIEADPLGGKVQTKVLVKDGQIIPAGAVVARTEIQCQEAGVVQGIRRGFEATRRILIVRDTDSLTLDLPVAPTLKAGDLVVAGSELAPGIVAAESGQVTAITGTTQIQLRRARPYRVSGGAILHVGDGDLVQRGDNLVLLVFERAKTGDIIQGLPRIEELLEARKPKEACVLSRAPGVCQVEYQEGETVDVKILEDSGAISEYPVLPGQNALVTDGQRVGVGEALTDGPANPHEILDVFFNYHLESLGCYEAALLGLLAAQSFLVDQVQQVYQSQGIDISDKHIEAIVRQMTSKVRVDDGGDTTMLPGELVELRQIEQVNEAMAITGGAPARYTPLLLGITKASLNTDSFISAASFQETTRVLTEAAIEGKSDWLRGLKENVIIGRLIPAGTGFNAHQDAVYEADDSGESRGGLPLQEEDEESMVFDDHLARAYADDDFDSLDSEEE